MKFKSIWLTLILGLIATPAFAAMGTLIVIFVTKIPTGGLRVEREDEIQGLDNALHGERGFEIAEI